MSSSGSKRSKSSKSRSDCAVQGTNDNSIVSKLSAAQHGYFPDDYLQYFVSKSSRRAPLINRGYYVRSKAVSHVLDVFLRQYANQRNQIVSLGTGFDSAYFRLQAEGQLGDQSVFCEVDFPDLVRRKAALIKQTEATANLIISEQHDTSPGDHIVINSKKYKLLGVDLTNLKVLTDTLDRIGLDRTSPTLFLSEVVLTYINPEKSSNIIQWAAETFVNSVFLTYEQIIPDDAFGHVMTNHFKSLGSALKCIDTFPSASSQAERYHKLGWSETVAVDMNYFFHEVLSPAERQRVESLEPFDEFEEWYLKCAHYIAITAFLGSCCALREEMWWKISEGGQGVHSGQFIAIGCSGDALDLDHSGATCVDQRTDGAHYSAPPVGHQHSSTAGQPSDDFAVTSSSSSIKLNRISVVSEVGSASTTKRFGHSMTRISENSTILTGGFGEMVETARHSRVKDVCCFRMNSEYSRLTCSHITVVDNENIDLLERMYHSSTYIGADRVVLFGGRTSPLKPLAGLCVLELSGSEIDKGGSGGSEAGAQDTLQSRGDKPDDTRNSTQLADSATSGTTCRVCPVETKNAGPCARWRHTAVFVDMSEQRSSLVIFGGCNNVKSALDDCWTLDLQEWSWRQQVSMETDGTGRPPCQGRYSHTADTWRNHMVVACGLGSDGRALNSVWMLHLGSRTWKELLVHGWLLPRFSHTSSVQNDTLILVGGVSIHARQPTVTVLDLTSGIWNDLDLPGQNPERPLMLHNHAMMSLTGHRMLVVGGGGNCFSFGTHLNSEPVLLELMMSTPKS